MFLCKNPKYLVRRNGKLYEIFSLDKDYLDICEIRDYAEVRDKQYKLISQSHKELIIVPCGVCEACRASQRDEWSLRCFLESKEYESNIFITLTYDNKHYPNDGVNKKDLQRFVHTLREYFRRNYGHVGIRYFGCGEYGDESYRPHYHIIFFNCPHFNDEKQYSRNKWGHKLYRSNTLEKLWKKGMCIIGNVNRHSIDYVVKCRLRYGKNIKAELEKKSQKSINTYFCNEFRMMSRKKGLGYNYLMANLDQIVHDGYIITNNKKKKRLPMYFNKIIKKIIGVENYNIKLEAPRVKWTKEFLLNHHDSISETTTQSKLSDKKLKNGVDYIRDITDIPSDTKEKKDGEDNE